MVCATRRVVALVAAPGYVAFSVSNSALGLSGFRVVAKLDGKPGGDKLLSLAFSRICGYGLRQEQPTGGCGKERRVRVRGIISVVAVAALMAALIAVAALPAFAAGRTRLPAVDLVASRR
jgi:hypothetical protein